MKPLPSRLCEKCGSDTRIMVQACVSAPSSMYHNFTRKNQRSKDFYFMGVYWESTDFICTNSKCGYVSNGFRGRLERLEKENAELKKLLGKE